MPKLRPEPMGLGQELKVVPGTYQVRLQKSEHKRLSLSLKKVDKPAVNEFDIEQPWLSQLILK